MARGVSTERRKEGRRRNRAKMEEAAKRKQAIVALEWEGQGAETGSKRKVINLITMMVDSQQWLCA